MGAHSPPTESDVTEGGGEEDTLVGSGEDNKGGRDCVFDEGIYIGVSGKSQVSGKGDVQVQK